MPVIINLHLDSNYEGYGKTNLKIEFRYINQVCSLDTDIFTETKNNNTKIIDEKKWEQVSIKKIRISHFKDNKKSEIVSALGDYDDSDAKAHSLNTTSIQQLHFAGPVDVPKTYEEIKKNHDDARETQDLKDIASTASKSTLNITYCIKLSYRADYDSIPTGDALNGLTIWRPYGDDRYQRTTGFIIELWDRDFQSSDDFIGSWYLDYTGPTANWSCVQFDWVQSITGEDYPDPYVRSGFKARSSTSDANVQVQIVNSQGNPISVAWRDAYINNCSGTCYTGDLKYSSSVSHIYNKIAMILVGAQRFSERWGYIDRYTHSPMKFRIYDSTPDRSYATSRNTAYIDPDHSRSWEVAAHEAGHMLQMQLFEQDALYGQACPDPHIINQPSNEACATQEGWANLVVAATYWSQYDPNSRPKLYGMDIEEPTPIDTSGCSSSISWNEDSELQVLKAFWDMIDVNNEAAVSPAYYNDEFDTGLSTLCAAWDSFPDGYGNHQDRELGETNNLYDLTYWLYSYFDTEGDYALNRTIIHNCAFTNPD